MTTSPHHIFCCYNTEQKSSVTQLQLSKKTLQFYKINIAVELSTNLYMKQNLSVMLTKLIGFAFWCLNLICWTAAKYFLINVQEENQEDPAGMLDDEPYRWTGLENNETVSLSTTDRPKVD